MSKELNIIGNNEASSESEQKQSGINRRQLVRRLVAGAGAGIALPALAATSHPVHKHLSDAATLAEADQQAASTEWTPLFLDPHQNETLVTLGELIIPNSTKAQCNRFIDLMLSVDTRENQQKFLNSLSQFDAYSLDKYQHPFKALNQQQQIEILTYASTTPAGTVEKHEGWTWMTVPKTPAEPERLTLRDHFENIKGWVSGAFYSSEIGMRELGWTGQVMFDSFPGCQHPGGHA